MRMNTRMWTHLMAGGLIAAVSFCLLPRNSPARGADWPAQTSPFQALSSWRPPVGQWQSMQAVLVDASNPERLSTMPGRGILVNGSEGRTVDLITREEFSDVEIHLEFCIPQHSNSGIYLMGRYELQIYDSFGVVRDKYPGIECGGIYPRWTAERGEFEGHSPLVNASKPAGEWQFFDITFRAPRFGAAGNKIEPARFLKVVHNGRVIHQDVTVNGPTRASHWDSESGSGPLLIQGDHGPVAIRNLQIRPLSDAGTGQGKNLSGTVR